jgi:DNA-binding NtrC family response regulator
MKTILVIDPFENHRYLLQEELQEAGYRVTTAGDVQEVLSNPWTRKLDLIILEVSQVNGHAEGLAELKMKYPQIPWVGYSTWIHCPERYERWVNFYLPKSSDLDPLKRLINSLCLAD